MPLGDDIDPSMSSSRVRLLLLPLAVNFFCLLLSLVTGCATPTPLVRAAARGDTKEALLLLDKGAKVNELSDGPTTALHEAAEHGHIEMVKLLISRGADVNNNCNWTPLHMAAARGHLDVVKALLAGGAEIGFRIPSGASALSFAVVNGHIDIVKFLLEKGAQADDKDIARAEKEGHSAIAILLRQAISRGNLLSTASQNGETIQDKEQQAPKHTIDSDVDTANGNMPERPNDFAVIVGIEKYSNDLPDAQFAEHDAAAVKSNLLALGYPERNIKFLTGQRATLSGLASYVEDWLPRNVKADSKVFFYFSGHGAPDPDSGQAYLVPWDGNPSYLATTAYPLKKLYAKLGALKAKQVIVALDSCFSGAGGRSVLAKGTRPLVNKVDMDVAADGKLILFAASSAKETTSTLDDQGHGIFTYYFLKGLGGEAKDDSGVISAQGLYDYLKPKVQDAASRQNRDQTPVLEGAAQDSELVRFK
jgi:hypothetical protein